MTNVLRASGLVVRMICRPEMIIKLVTNTIIAPITGVGMIERTALNFGENPSRMNKPPAANSSLCGQIPKTQPHLSAPSTLLPVPRTPLTGVCLHRHSRIICREVTPMHSMSRLVLSSGTPLEKLGDVCALNRE
jgi:hypothetical protein